MSISPSALPGAEPRFECSPSGHLGSAFAAVTERGGGVSVPPFASLNLGRSTPDMSESVRANEGRVLEALRLRDSVARLRLEHGARVQRVDQPGLQGPSDALVTAREDLILWLTVADCYPLFVVAGTFRALGHCGWRGTAAGLVEALIEELAGISGVSPAEQRAWIGPGIGPCCYEVGPEVARRFPSTTVAVREGRLHLDLPAVARLQLLEGGLSPGSLEDTGACTACEPAWYFSHRRDDGCTGHLWGLAALRAGA